MKTKGLFRNHLTRSHTLAAVAALGLATLLSACSAAPGSTPIASAPLPLATSAPPTATQSPEPTAPTTAPASPSAPATSPSAQPTPSGTSSGSVLRFNAVSFSGATGWIGGDGAIDGTHDGGTTWRRAWSGTDRAVQVSAVSASVAWAALARTADPQAAPVALLRTADGGTTWTRVVLAKPLEIHATGALTAWAVGRTATDGPGDLERTIDGGATWKPVSTPSTIDDVCASGSLLWIASGRHVWLSSDSGSTWASRDPGDLATGSPLRASLGCSGDAVWMLVTGGVGMSQQAYAVTRSLDRGTHWQVVYTELQAALGALASVPPNVQTIDAYSGPFAVVSPNVARFAGWCPACGVGTTSFVATNDGGSTSRHVAVAALDGAGAPASMAFADANDGWLVGSQKPIVVRTRDGGATWSQVTLP